MSGKKTPIAMLGVPGYNYTWRNLTRADMETLRHALADFTNKAPKLRDILETVIRAMDDESPA
jgi:hypothetical protein